MQPKAYVVTQGEYSDYSIVAVFSTRELADEFVAQQVTRYPDYRVEEYPINEPLSAGHWKVRMDYDTGQVRSAVWSAEEKRFEPSLYKGTLATHLVARSAEQAIKATNEIRTRHKALGYFC